MMFATVEPHLCQARIVGFKSLFAAERAIGLEPNKIDFAIVSRDRDRGIGIIVFEYGLFVPPHQQAYFAIEQRLYAGNALLYAFNQVGETIDFEPPLPFIDFFNGALDVEQAIHDGRIVRPQMLLNGKVIWSWPAERPKELAIKL